MSMMLFFEISRESLWGFSIFPIDLQLLASTSDGICVLENFNFMNIALCVIA